MLGLETLAVTWLDTAEGLLRVLRLQELLLIIQVETLRIAELLDHVSRIHQQERLRVRVHDLVFFLT